MEAKKDRKDEPDTATSMVAMKQKHTGNDSERNQRFLQHKGNHSNNKEAYTMRTL